MRSRLPLRLAKTALLHTPDVIPFMLKGAYHKRIGVHLEHRRGDGVASRPPLLISARITNACNHRCAVCGQYGTKGYMGTDKGRPLLKTLPVSVYKDLIDQVAPFKPALYVTGGEPFLYPGSSS